MKPRPKTDFDIEQFPASMISARRWVAWKPVERDGKWTKIPWSAETDGPASSTDPATWSSFADATEYALERSHGLGFMLGDGWLGIDCDAVAGPKWTWRDDWIGEWAASCKTFVEWSPSGTGIHAIFRGASLPEWAQNRRGNIEVYERARFFCMTGDTLYRDRDAIEAQDAVDAVCRRFLERTSPNPTSTLTSTLTTLTSAPRDDSAEDWRLACALAEKGYEGSRIAEMLQAKMIVEGRAEKAARPDYVRRTVEGALKTVGEVDEDAPVSIRPLGEIISEHPEKTPYLIEGLLRRGEVGAVIAPPKCRKSFLMHDLAVCTARGLLWLQQFRTAEGRVLLVDNELTGNEIADRTRTILASRAIPVEAVSGRLDVLSLREDSRKLDAVLRALQALEKPYDLVIFDALYMFLEQGMDENSNADMTVLLRRFRRFASASGAAVILVHHTAKGSAANKESIDLGAGAGALGRAVDLNVGIYRHEEEGAFVCKFNTRSSPPVADFGIRWSYPRFGAAIGLDCTQLHGKRKSSD